MDDLTKKKKRGAPRDRKPAIVTLIMLVYYGLYIFGQMFWDMGDAMRAMPFIMIFFGRGIPGIILAALYLAWRWSWEHHPYWKACVPLVVAIVGLFIIANVPLQLTGLQLRLNLNLEEYTNVAEMLLVGEIEEGNASPEYCYLADDCEYWKSFDRVYFVIDSYAIGYGAFVYTLQNLPSDAYEYKLHPHWYYVIDSYMDR